MHKATLIVLAAALGLSASATARAEPEHAHVGLSLELPLLAVYSYHASAPPHGLADDTIEQSGVEVGPFMSDDGFGAQVPLQVGVSVVIVRDFAVGARFGFAPTCLDGPGNGEQGTDFNWQAEPFGRYIFASLSGFQVYAQGGPFFGHSCVGDTEDQDVSNLIGLHLGAGTEYDLNNWLALYGELRGISAWGEHQFRSHGEVPARRDGFDLRGQLVLGASVWF